ncbi:MAG: DUF4249 domain-containing protein [Flavobacteriales bacterium]|nr:DUF4249 domain-containing protein [Flavobacteriales bacterium]
MNKLIAIGTVVLIIVMISCRKEIPFTSEVTTSKLVVNSLFEADSSWNINVSRSLSVIDEAELASIENATVTIKDGTGTLIETLVHDADGNYIGTSYPQIGNTYRVDVSAAGYTSVYGEDLVPDPVNVISIDTAATVISGEEYLGVSITFDDPSGVKNYYRLSVLVGLWDRWDNGMGGLDSAYWEEEVYLVLNDPAFEGNGADSWQTEGIMTDLLFDGQQRTVEVGLDSWFFNNSIVRIQFIDVLFFNSTETTYLFNKSYSLYQETNGNPFAQPVQVYSNITNGFGIFGGAQLFTHRIN